MKWVNLQFIDNQVSSPANFNRIMRDQRRQKMGFICKCPKKMGTREVFRGDKKLRMRLPRKNPKLGW